MNGEVGKGDMFAMTSLDIISYNRLWETRFRSKPQKRYEEKRLSKTRQRNKKVVQHAVKIQCNSQAEKASKMHISSPIVVQTQLRFEQVEEGIRKASEQQTT